MAALNETKLREALLAQGLCDRETAIAVSTIAQSIWTEATVDFATEDKIAVAIADLRAALLEVIHENERFVAEQLVEMRRELDAFRVEQAERDAAFRLEMAERDAELRREMAERDAELHREMAERDARMAEDQERRDNRLRWVVAIGFAGFGTLTSLLAVFA